MTKAVKMLLPVEGGWHEGNSDDGTGVWRDYPPVGEVLVTNDDHADNLVASGRAEYHSGKAEARSAPETRPAPDDAEKRDADKAASLASQQAVAARSGRARK